MNSEVKTKWLAALRSGEYCQGEGHLRNVYTNKFCCLGVLCDIYSKEKSVSWNDSVFIGQRDYLPDEVMEWGGVTNSKGNYSLPNEQEARSLAKDNDTGKTFAEIAKIIEEKF